MYSKVFYFRFSPCSSSHSRGIITSAYLKARTCSPPSPSALPCLPWQLELKSQHQQSPAWPQGSQQGPGPALRAWLGATPQPLGHHPRPRQDAHACGKVWSVSDLLPVLDASGESFVTHLKTFLLLKSAASLTCLQGFLCDGLV